MGQRMAAPHLQQALKIVHLVSLYAKSLHQAHDQAVIVFPDLVAAVLFRLEVARDAELVRVIEHDAGLLVRDALGNCDVGVEPLLFFAGEMNKTAHGGQKAPSDGKPKPKPAGEAAASGVCLVKDVVHLRQLGVCHADAGVPDIHKQIDAIVLPPGSDADVYAALLGELDGVFHQDLEHVGNFLRVSDEDRRHFRVDVKHQLQVLAVALQGGHGDHVVQHRRDHILLFGGGQRALHDLRVVQHIVDLAGQTLSRHFDGGHLSPDLRRKIPSQGHLADANHHVDGRAELMGHV